MGFGRESPALLAAWRGLPDGQERLPCVFETDPADATLAAYQAGAEQYRQASSPPGPAMVSYLNRLADLVPGGHVLEIGSGPGWDALSP